MNKKWTPHLTYSELLMLEEHGYMIRSTWVMPPGHYEYYLIRMGGYSAKESIFEAFSMRACFSYFTKHIKENENVEK